MDELHQKPARIQLRPGERWLSADGESAVITSIDSSLRWGADEVIRIRFIWLRGDQSAVATLPLAEFRRRFPISGDLPP